MLIFNIDDGQCIWICRQGGHGFFRSPETVDVFVPEIQKMLEKIFPELL
jgi:hypothetical protein